MSMQTLLRQALTALPKDKQRPGVMKELCRKPVMRKNPASQQFVRSRVSYRDLTKRWFAFSTPCGRVARQSIILPNKNWTRAGDDKGYATALEAMRA